MARGMCCRGVCGFLASLFLVEARLLLSNLPELLEPLKSDTSWEDCRHSHRMPVKSRVVRYLLNKLLSHMTDFSTL